MIANTNNKKDIFLDISNHFKEYILEDELSHSIVSKRTEKFLDLMYDKGKINRKDFDLLGRNFKSIIEIIKSAS